MLEMIELLKQKVIKLVLVRNYIVAAFGYVILGVIALVVLLAVLMLTSFKDADGAPVSMCAPFSVFGKNMEEKYGEIPLIIFEDGNLVKIMFATPSGTTWTLAAMEGNGVLCTFRNGVHLELFNRKRFEEGK